jgi:CRP/FNR family cyclic AMP-dependent transcriptional regulator
LRIIGATEHTDLDTERLIRRIPFFNEIFESSEEQLGILLSLSDVLEVSAGETVIEKGDTDMSLYFLLKGQLGVYLDSDSTEAINYISPGEVFGILSMMTQTPRSAFIKADENAKSTLLFKLDFGYLTDNSLMAKLSLDTRLIFYRMALHNIRWTLERNKMSDPNHHLVEKIRKLPFVSAPKGTQEELDVLKEQALSLSDILFEWNSSQSTAPSNNPDQAH